LLKENGCIIYPTETFYALGCAADNSEAVGKIYSLKKRNRNQPLLVLIDSWEMFDRYTSEVGEAQLKLLKKHWPGPLTAILKQKGNLAAELNHGGSALGFRMTSSPIARELIQIAGLPLVGTSANRSGKQEIADCDSVKKIFSDTVDIYIDGGKTPGILPSTLVDLTTDVWTVVRQGMISI
jgi:L-threonylcarbamoyladenylate synthase